jgi:tetratricopeptide (TPR) repeat protein
MPEKKKITAAKSTERRMTKPQASKPVKTAEPVRATVPSRGGAAAVTQPLPGAKQLSSFEAAMKLFHSRNLKDARDFFRQATEGPERDIANRARMHMAMCDQRLQRATIDLGSAEDYYNYGVALLNTRNVAEARKHLEKALQLSPGSDHIHYALAAAQALGGDGAAAFENLKRAIELDPRNRLIARQDADLNHLANQPPFDTLLYPEKKTW